MVGVPSDPRPAGINPLEPELKPRPLRTREIVWDLFPTAAIIGWCVLVLIADEHSRPPHTDAMDFAGGLMGIAFGLSVGSAIWMQLSNFKFIGHITRLEWRESLWLTDVKAREYLVSQFKSRAMIQAIPFAVGLLGCALAVALSFYDMTQEEWSQLEVIFGAGMIYALISMQICGLCAGLMGRLNSIRSGCQPKTSELSRIFIIFKWIVIVLMTPFFIMLLGIFVAGFVESFFVGSPDDADDVILFTVSGTVAFGAYCLFACTLLNLFFYHRLKISWKKTQDEFFKFE